MIRILFPVALLAAVSFGNASAYVTYTVSGYDSVMRVENTRTALPAYGIGVKATGNAGSVALRATGAAAGIQAYGTNAGVEAFAPNGAALRGTASNNGNGLEASSLNGYGLISTSTNGVGAQLNGGPVAAQVNASVNSGTALETSGSIALNSYAYNADNYGYAAVLSGSSWASTGGSSHGVNVSSGGGDYSYGITANAYAGAIENWSGWFWGDVYVGGTFSNPSDIKFKKNIHPLEGGLATVMALKPKTYDMRNDEFEGKITLPKGKQYGLIAQELEEVLPTLVHPATTPIQLTDAERKKGVKKDPVKFKSVNYQALIPILVEAVQEQQALIEKQQAMIEALQRKVGK